LGFRTDRRSSDVCAFVDRLPEPTPDDVAEAATGNVLTSTNTTT
jgi:hypothetical protein